MTGLELITYVGYFHATVRGVCERNLHDTAESCKVHIYSVTSHLFIQMNLNYKIVKK